MGHFPKGMPVAERQAMTCLRRDLASGAHPSWGHLVSPHEPWRTISADVWKHMQYVDVSQEKFGFHPLQPETFAWGVRVDIFALPDRKVEEWDYLDTAALALVYHFGMSWNMVKDELAAAVFGGRGHETIAFNKNDDGSVSIEV